MRKFKISLWSVSKSLNHLIAEIFTFLESEIVEQDSVEIFSVDVFTTSRVMTTIFEFSPQVSVVSTVGTIKLIFVLPCLIHVASKRWMGSALLLTCY